jgi:hypothetical protein
MTIQTGNGAFDSFNFAFICSSTSFHVIGSLTLPSKDLRTKGTVQLILDSFYAQWRLHCGVVPVLHEDSESPPERLLQAIWLHQRLLRDQLRTLDGRPVRILHPGFRNLEGGPDFRAAVVQFGDEPARSGDIEVDLRSRGWRDHGHDHNPAFENVILHVIWESDRPAPGAPPVLLLRPVLDSPLGELSVWLVGEAALSLPEASRGHCCAGLRQLSTAALCGLLQQAAQARFRSKAAQFQARARQAGWEQSLWEGLFRGLGYKHNVWPMQRLAELRPLWSASNTNALTAQARLLGLSGLLPTELTRTQTGTDDYLRCMWDQWWRDREQFAEAILPGRVWHLHGLRPANHPQRRLALAAHWTAAGDLAKKLENWFTEVRPADALPGALLRTLRPEQDDFWCKHWTLRSKCLPKELPLIGATRVTDLAINVVLPWLWMRAAEGRNEALKHELEEQYSRWPAAGDNAVLRLARQRLLGRPGRPALPSAAAQQGLMQIVSDFCEHSNAVCDNCKLPEMVWQLVKQQSKIHPV